VEPCDPENNCTLSLSLQVWNSSNTEVYPWQVKVQKKQKRKRKIKGGTPYEPLIQAHSGIVVSADFIW
jgi:hypothetical protein